MNENKHAAARLVQRYSGEVLLEELEERVRKRDFHFERRLTNTRSLCWVELPNLQRAWFIYSKEKREIVTVLSEEQARAWL